MMISKSKGAAAAARSFVFALMTGASVQAFSVAHAQPANAQAPERETLIAFDIAPQPLASGLALYARQAGVRILFSYNAFDALTAPGVHGELTREEALARLLASSGYRGRIGADNVLQLEPPPRPQHASADDVLRLDQAPVQQGDVQTEESAAHSSDEQTDEETIVVTGTRIRGANPAGAHVIALNRDAIEQSGRTTLQDVLQTLPEVFPGSQNEVNQLNSTVGGRNIAFGSTVDLRGLGSDATLTLLNGRRMAPAGFGNFIDISSIPLAAIDRVEVLADGASATYGSDAVGGVVNIILRKDFNGAETTARYGAVTDGTLRDQGFSQVFGASSARGSLLLGYEYSNRSNLPASERAFAADTDLRAFGGSNFSRTNSNPGNIIRVGTTTVQYAIPQGQDGTHLTQSQLISGQTNFQNGNEGADLLPAQTTHSLFASGRLRLTDRLEVFADLLGSQRDAEAADTQLATTLTVPQTNAYRVLDGLFPGAGNITVGYFFGNDLGPLRYHTESRALSVVTGARYDITDQWQLEATAAFGSHTDQVRFYNSFDSTAIASALASSDLATAFNPFADGSNTAASVLQHLTFSQDTRGTSEVRAYGLKADGPLFALPAGEVRVAVGIENREEEFSINRFETRASGVINPLPIEAPGHRTVTALFGELAIPLVDDSAHVPLMQALNLSLSIRQEHSDDFGTATTPKTGVRWVVNNDLALRATWGTSFKAPQFQQMLGGSAGTISSAPASLDPFATNGSTGALQITGSNPNLRPEEAETWTAGFDLTPGFAHGLALHATYFDIDFANRISTPGSVLDALRNGQNYVGYFIRNPTPEQIATYLAIPNRVVGTIPPDGIEVIWDERLTNLASLRVRGLDVAADYSWVTDLGEFTAAVSASGLLQFTRTTNPALPSADLLDTILNPIDWRGRASIAWRRGAWRSSLSANYTDDYADNLSTPPRHIDAWTTYDLEISRTFGVGHGLQATLNIRNLTDEDPPFANNPVGMAFDSLNASPIGRVVYLELRQRW